MPIKDLVDELGKNREKYLSHRKVVDNAKAICPVLMEAYSEVPYIHLDCSENIALKAKDEVQEAPYSGKQYTLHCPLLDPPNPYKFIYHLSDDTIHDGLFVETVLRDIIQLQNFHNQVILIKSDNCPSQYKCKNVFPTYQNDKP